MPTLTRRTLLVGALAALAAGCAAQHPNEPAPIATSTAPTPDPQIPDVTGEMQLIALYDAAIRARPRLAATLAPIRADHVAHYAALRKAVRGTGVAGAAPRVPAGTAATLAALRTAETTAATRATASCLRADPSRAGLLGSIAASEQSHLVPLGGTPSVAAPGAIGAAGGPAAELAGLQSVLGAQNAVRWGYDIVGGQVSSAVQHSVRSVQATHVSMQETLQAAIWARHATPAAAEAGYALPFTVSSQASALRLAATLEARSGPSWRYLLGVTSDPALRRFAAAGLRDAAVRATQWRARYGPATTAALP
jgi:hypothetical protein